MKKLVNLQVDAQGMEMRAVEARMDVEDGKLRGYAAVFDKLSLDLGGFCERFAKGAFSRTLREGADVRALWQHNPDYVLGRTKSNTLQLEEDAIGLVTLIDPPDTQWARDAITTIKRGDVDQMSFKFRILTDEWNLEGGELVRTVMDADLIDVSPVTFPAYPQTSISARSVNVLNSGDDNGSARLANLRRRLELLEVENI